MKRLARLFGAGPKKPELPLDLLAPAFLADPYPSYAWLRDNAPVAEVAGGGVLLTRHADIKAAFTSPDLGNAPSRFSVLAARNRARHVAADLAANIPPFLDAPEHILPRQALSRAFHDAFRAQEQEISELALSHVRDADQSCDLVRDVARPFVCRAMARFLGVDWEDADLKEASGAFFTLFAPIRDPAVFATTNKAMEIVRARLAETIARRKQQPGPDLISGLLAFQKDTPDLTDAMIADSAILILADGIENIEAGAASVLRVLLSNNAECTQETVREALRLETPGQIIPRVARRDTHVSGVPLKEGMPVFLALASANRDSDVFDAPSDFRPERVAEDVFTFGRGRHRCIGEPLALLQLTTLIAALLKRGAREAGHSLTYAQRFGHRWPTSMAISFPVAR